MTVLRVALDVPLATLFDYARAPQVDARIGDRVVVPFSTRSRVGVVIEEAGSSAIDAAKLRAVTRTLGDAPRLTGPWLEFMRFLAGYYQRPLGETVMGALPPRLRSLKPLPAKVRDAALAAHGSPQFVSSHALTEAQAQTVDRLASAAGRYAAFLLHGVTGSGKTEVYLRAIARVLERGG